MTVEHRSEVALQGGDNDDRGKGERTASRTTGRCRGGLRRGAAAATCTGPPACPESPPTANRAERAAADGAGTRARPTRAAQADRAGPGTDAARAAKAGRSGPPTGGGGGSCFIVPLKRR